jgi:hypothetical protein
MTHDTIARNSRTPSRKHIVVGAASVLTAGVLTAGALIGVGAAGASADTLAPAFGPSASAAPQSHDHEGRALGGSVVRQIREAFFQAKVDGAAAQKLATAAVGRPALFSKLPTALQTDLSALKNPPATERDADAQKITTTALGGGYGEHVKGIATALKSGANRPLGALLREALASGLAHGESLGDSLRNSAEKSAPAARSGADTHTRAPATSDMHVTAGN